MTARRAGLRALPRSLSAAAVWLAAATASAQDLQWAPNPANGRWYGVPFPPSTWTAGEALALAQGGHLATVRSAAENAWVAGTFAGVNPQGLWIGLNDAATEGTFVWTSGEPLAYTNWNPGEPNNAGGVQDAVRVLPGSSWRWDDVDPADATTTPLVERAEAPLAGWSLPQAYTAQSMPGQIAVADLNGDGRADVIAPNQFSDTLSVFLGAADGTLGPATSVACPGGPVAVAVTRLDPDAVPDLVVACYGSQVLRPFHGTGTGDFVGLAQILVGGGARPVSILAADLDGDGDQDLAFTTSDGTDRLRVLFRDELGAFPTGASYPTGSSPWRLSCADLDGDGDRDLVVSCRDSDELGIYTNQGDGAFLTGALLMGVRQPGRAALGDLDGDGRIDLAVPSAFDGGVKVLWGQAGGTFDPLGPLLATGSEPRWAEAADFDRDGRLDLIVANFTGDSVTVHRSLGLGAFAPATHLRVGDGPVCVLARDLAGDGRLELCAGLTNAGRVAVLTNLARDCNANGVDDVSDIALGSSADCNANGIPDECDLAQGADFDCDGNGAVDSCEIAAQPDLDLDRDAVLDACESAGTAYCLGDGTGVACPCDPGQVGAPGSGCRNSAGSGGRLVGVGNASVALDSVSLRATGLPPGAVGLFFQGTLQQNAGLGTPFGDGLLCVNGTIVRLQIRAASGGAMAFGRDVPGDPRVSQDGQVPGAGATRHYQVWYRDAVPFCSTSPFNLTNGLRIVWQP